MAALFDRLELGTAIMNALEMTWTTAQKTADTFGDDPFMRDRGVREKSGANMSSVEMSEYCMKAGYLLMTQCEELDLESVREFLPSVSNLLAWSDVNPDGRSPAKLFGEDSFLLSALVSEMIGEANRSLGYLEYVVDINDTEVINSQSSLRRYKLPSGTELQARLLAGYDPKFVSQILGKCCKGRVLASQGKRRDSMVAFESAVAQAQARDLYLLVALALRDMCMLLKEGHTAERTACDRRLGACLEELNRATTPELDSFLNGSFSWAYPEPLRFDAASLMR